MKVLYRNIAFIKAILPCCILFYLSILVDKIFVKKSKSFLRISFTEKKMDNAIAKLFVDIKTRKIKNLIGGIIPIIRYSIYVLICFSFCTSCKKLIEVDPPVTSINAANVYSSDATAAAVLTGIYTNMSKAQISSGGISSLSLFPGLSADELTLFNYSSQTNAANVAYYTNSLTNLNTGSTDFWNNLYPFIFVANAAIEGVSNSDNITANVKQQLLGEAKFVRALCYFYLVNLYGDVPLALTTDYNVNRLLARTSKAQIYTQTIQDLKDAQSLLSDRYMQGDRINFYPDASAERIFPNKSVATALLARTFLYVGDYSNAEAQTTNIINIKTKYDTVALKEIFLKNSKEAIWQLQPVVTTPITNTWDARLFVLKSGGPDITGTYPVYLSTDIVNSFEVGDKRKLNWVDSVSVGGLTYNYPYKYKNVATSGAPTEYLMVFRLAEQYLIRSEARTQQNNISGGLSDLNIIRKRAGLSDTTILDKNSLLKAIWQERKIELFTEWGHRWFDLKRTGIIDSVMSIKTPKKANGNPWKSYQAYYPIPQSELDRDPNLNQNQGY